MYELNSRVRYSETDIDAKLSLTGIMNYMQDCSTMQSEDAGVGIGYLGREKKAWLLSSWQIVIGRRPVLGRTDQGSDMAICGEGALCTEKFRDP